MADNTTELEVLNQIVDVLGGQSGQYETVVPVLQQIKELLASGITDPEAIAAAVSAWLDEHPEATTTVQDGSITGVKIADNTIPDAKLAQTGGVLEAVDEITNKLQLVTIKSKNLCSGVTSGYMAPNGSTSPSASYVYTNRIDVSAGMVINAFGTYSNIFRKYAIRFLAAFDENGNVVPSAGANDDVRDYVVPEGIASIVATFYVNDLADYVVTADYTPFSYVPYFEPRTYYVATDGFINNAAKRPCKQVSGALADGGTLEIAGRSAIKDGQTIVFKGYLTTFNVIALNFDTTTQITNYVQVDGTNVTIKNHNNPMEPVAHGLTIQHDIKIICEFVNGTAKITVISDGETFTTTVQWTQTSGATTQPQVASDGTVCDEATLSVAYPAALRKVWYFGDSYISMNDPARWPYYLGELLQNVLLSGASGASSASSTTALNTLVEYGTPKVAVFGTGMNDGYDSSTYAPQLWKTNAQAFVDTCQQNGIEPIFCTIPTVPTVNNEQKNAIVRASGYRYIDFAAAVGANASGEWYAGMLSSDNVHPSAKGAKALYSQVLADLPEIFIPA